MERYALIYKRQLFRIILIQRERFCYNLKNYYRNYYILYYYNHMYTYTNATTFITSKYLHYYTQIIYSYLFSNVYK